MTADNPTKPRGTLVLWAGVVLVPLLTLHFYVPTRSGLWIDTFLESLHFVVFGTIAIGLYGITPKRWSDRRRFTSAILASIALSLVSEAAQIPGSRDASFEDLVRDWLGTIFALLVVFASLPSSHYSRKSRITALLVAAMCLLWGFYPLAKVSLAFAERDRQLPILFTAEQSFGRSFLRKQNVHVLYDAETGDSTCLQVTLGDGPWPGIAFHNIWPDWSAHPTLIVDIVNKQDDVLELQMRVHDRIHRKGKQPYEDRYNRGLTLSPGENSIRVDIADIENAPRGRRMNLEEIDELIVFAPRGLSGRSFCIRQIRLD